MLQVRPSNERDRNHLDWLNTRFTFSFDRYHAAKHMGFGRLRVLNEDWISPGGGYQSEFNPPDTATAHLLQILLTPGYEGKMVHSRFSRTRASTPANRPPASSSHIPSSRATDHGSR